VLTDTSIAVSSLVFGGVLDEFENLRVCLSHGGGTFPWVYPRLLALGGTAINPREEWDRQISRLYVDALVFDPEHLELLKTRFGVDHIIGGTDYPFIAGLVDPGAILEEGFSTGIFNRAEVDRIRFANAFEFLGESLPEM
jgi:aminocarboxymuconate-semialdehyde decarboxylase